MAQVVTLLSTTSLLLVVYPAHVGNTEKIGRVQRRRHSKKEEPLTWLLRP